MVVEQAFTINESNYFKWHLNVLIFLGIKIYPVKNRIVKKILPIYGIVQKFFVMPQIICLVFNGYYVSQELTGLVYAISSCSLAIFAIVKGMLLEVRRDKIRYYMNKIEHEEPFKPRLNPAGYSDEFKLTNSGVHLCELLAKLTYGMLFIGLITSTITTWLTPIKFTEIWDEAINATIYKKVRPFVSFTWFPFGFEFVDSPAYELMLLYQTLASVMLSFSVTATDGVICGFMIYLRVKFLVLGHRLKSFVEFAEDQPLIRERDVEDLLLENGVSGQNLESMCIKPAERVLNSCIRYHQQLLTLCGEINNEFSIIMLMQLIGSTTVTFSMMFILSSNLDNSAALSYVFYLNWVILQIFMYCYFGNEIELLSSEIADFIYQSNWTNVDLFTKKSLLLIILRSQRPCEFTAGNFKNFNLETFVSIMKGAFSYFTALQTLSDKY